MADYNVIVTWADGNTTIFEGIPPSVAEASDFDSRLRQRAASERPNKRFSSWSFATKDEADRARRAQELRDAEAARRAEEEQQRREEEQQRREEAARQRREEEAARRAAEAQAAADKAQAEADQAAADEKAAAEAAAKQAQEDADFAEMERLLAKLEEETEEAASGDNAGNSDGSAPTTSTPTTMTSKTNDEVPPVNQRPKTDAPKPEEPAPEVDTTAPAQPEAPAEEPAPEAPTDAEQPAPVQTELPSFAAAPANETPIEADTAPPKNEEPGIPVAALPDTAQQQMPSNMQVTIISPEEYAKLTGAGGDSGGSGGGGLPSEALEEIPDIVKMLHDGFAPGWTGLGTDEGKVLAALKMIRDKAHLDAVAASYQEAYGERLGNRLSSEYRLEPGSRSLIKELNRELNRLGYNLSNTGSVSAYTAPAESTSSDSDSNSDETFDASEWGGDESLEQYPVTELRAARQKYYENLDRENEIFFDSNGNVRRNLSTDEQQEIDDLEAGRKRILAKYGNGILSVGANSVSITLPNSNGDN